jgi:hypothetical protein
MATAKNKKNTPDIALTGLGGEPEPDTSADSQLSLDVALDVALETLETPKALTREADLVEAFHKYGYSLYVEQQEKGLLVLDTIDGTDRYDLDNITVRYTTK